MAKRAKSFYNPYRDLIGLLNRAGVDYVVVGMSGINFYAQSAKESFATYDYDLFLKPVVANAAKALKVFRESGYEVVTKEGAVTDENLKKILSQKKTIIAADPYGSTFELLFAVSGFMFSQMADDATIFTVDGVPICVGKLHKLLASKKAAGRPKDKLFLKRYAMMLKEFDKESGTRKAA